MFLQLAAVNELDALKLKILLISSKHEECILTSKELKTLQEAVAILEVAYDATIILEEEEALISMVGPTLSQIHKKWTNMKDNVSSTCETLVASLLASLKRRFHGLFENIGIIPRRQQGEGQSVDQPFGDSLYVVAAALDQQFGLDWVDDAIKQGCGLGLGCLVSRRSRDLPTSRLGQNAERLGLVSVSRLSVSVSAIRVSCTWQIFVSIN